MAHHDDSGIRYGWDSAADPDSCGYLNAAVLAALESHRDPLRVRRLLDIGCGNGAFMRWAGRNAWDTVGLEPSEDGHALATSLGSCVFKGGVYDSDLLPTLPGPFPYAVSMEVVEHLYYPRRWAAFVFAALQPGGIAVVTTPYHGYLKNLVLAASGRLDGHFHALWDHGHIKFFSVRSLSTLVSEAGFVIRDIRRIGRIPALAKSMLFVLQRPS